MPDIKKTTFILVSVVLAITACADIRGSGNVVTEKRAVRDFKRVAMSASGELIIAQGDTESLTIQAEDNIMPFIKSEVRGKTLHISLEGDSWGERIRPTEKIIFKVNIIDIDKVDFSGSGSLKAANLAAGSLHVNISGSADVGIDQLKVEKFRVDLKGSGDFALAGEAGEQKIRIIGSGDYQASRLISQTARVKINGSGSAAVAADKSLDVEINGSGEVDYYGSPRVTADINGSGSVSKRK